VTTLSFNRYTLQCEGCPARFGEPHGYNSPDIARIASRQHGWGTPPIRRTSGHLGVITSDVCPACLPTWEPVTMAGRRHARRLAVDEAPDSWPTPMAAGDEGASAPLNDLTPPEIFSPVGYLALCLAHIRAGYPITELGTGLVMYVAPTQAEVDHARHVAHVLATRKGAS
jgi:hypothetical protein